MYRVYEGYETISLKTRHLSGGCTRSLWCTQDTRSNAMEAGPQDTGLCIQRYKVYKGYEGYEGRPEIFYRKLDTFLRGVQSVQGVRGIRDYFSENQTPFRRVYKVYKVYRGYKVYSLGS